MRKKQNKVVIEILKAVSSIVFIVLIGVLINGYSKHIGLFDTFEVKIKGNQFVTDAQIQKQLQNISGTWLRVQMVSYTSWISGFWFFKAH